MGKRVGGSKLTLLLQDPEFQYLTTIMQMYVDSGKAYVQVATGALVLPIVFLRNLLGLGEHDALGWIPGPIWISWILLLVSIGAGLGYQVRAVGYLEAAMEGNDDPDEGTILPKEPGFLFDVMAFAFYLGVMYFVIGAAERMFYHAWLPYAVCPLATIGTVIFYYKAL
jgi:hypothetical protein